MKSFLTRISLLALALSLTSVCSFAAGPAADSAGNPGYPGAYTPGGNPGFGFLPWVMVPTPGAGFAANFYGSSVGNGDGLDDGLVGGLPGDGDINSPGAGAWGLAAGGGGVMDVYRGFALGPMVPGETFSLAMDNGFLAGSPPGTPPGFASSVGFTLDVGVGVGAPALFTFGFVGGDATYSFIDALGVKVFTPIAFTDEGLNVSVLAAPGAGASLLTIKTKGGAMAAIPITLAGPPVQVHLFDNNGAGAGGGGSFDVFFNDFAIAAPVPEPTTFALLGFGVLGALALRRCGACTFQPLSLTRER